MDWKDPEQVREYQRKWRAANRERLAEQGRTYREVNRERLREYFREYQQTHKERRQAQSADWACRNPEARKEISRRSDAKRRQKLQEYKRRYYQDNKELYATYVAQRRARVLGAEGSHTTEEWLATLWMYDHKCQYCGASEPLEKDHIIPLSRGGTDYVDNLQPLCRSCNRSKSAKLESELGCQGSVDQP